MGPRHCFRRLSTIAPTGRRGYCTLNGSPQAPAELAAQALESFEVVCQRSGVTLEVSSDVSILEALEDASIPILGSCYEGVCGTCEAKVLQGTPDHRDSVLTEAEQAAGDVIMACVSRSRTERLVLDL